MGYHKNHLVKAILMSTHKIGFYGEISKIIFQLASDITKYTPCLSLVMRKLAFCICENKDADQLLGNSEADQHLCFRYIDGTIPLLPIYEISRL